MNREPDIGFTACAVACALLAIASPLAAKTITGEQAARVATVLEACVVAVTSESSAVFDDWAMERGFVPVAYLSYERWVSPEGDYKITFGQRGDRPGRPFVCEAVREVDAGNFLSGDQVDHHIIRWVNTLPETVMSGVRFGRGAGFENAANAEALSGCIAGQRLLLNAGITDKGAARFGVSLPLNEVLEC